MSIPQIPAGLASSVGGIVGFVGLAWGLSKSVYHVEGGHKAIKFNRFSGLSPETYSDGTHFLMPWFEWPIIMNVRDTARTMVCLTGSKDLQMVSLSFRTLTRPNPQKLQDVYRELGLDYDEVVLPSILNEVAKSVVAQFNASQLMTQREEVSRLIYTQVCERARDFNIVVDDFSVTETRFSPEYEKAVERKQVAHQEVQAAHYKVLQAHEMKKAIIIKAQGEQAAAELIGTAMRTNPGFVELRRIEVAKEVATALSQSANRVVLSTDSLMLNLFESTPLSS